MKIFFKNGLKFLVLLIFGYILLLFAAGTFNKIFNKPNLIPNLSYVEGGHEGFSWSRFREIDTVKNVDVMILGSSHAYRGYDPRILKEQGWSSFNLGSSSQTPEQTRYVFNKYVDKLNPKYVVLDAYPLLLNSDGVESSLDLLSNMPFSWDMLPLVLHANDIRIYNAFIYAATLHTFGIKSGFTETKHFEEDDYISGGYTETNKVIKMPFVKHADDSNIKAEGKLFDDQVSAIKDIVEELKNRKISYSIYQAPILPERYKEFGNINKIDSVLKTIDKDYINFNDKTKLSEELFADDSHLNQQGVNIYNKYIIDSVIIKKQKIK